MSSFDGSLRHRAVNACLAPLCSVDGCHVMTVEGIGTTTEPHAVQRRIAEQHGSQCGFCTPGIVMALYSTLQSSKAPTLKEIEKSFDGNLCRRGGTVKSHGKGAETLEHVGKSMEIHENPWKSMKIDGQKSEK